MSAFTGVLPDWAQVFGLVFGCLLAAAGLIQIYRNKCREARGHNRLEPSDLITAGVAVVFIGTLLIGAGGIWHWRRGESPLASTAFQSPANGPDLSTAIQSPISIKKSYPKHTRDMLDKAMIDLSDILNGAADDVTKQAARVQNIWDSEVSRLSHGRVMDTELLRNEINTLRDLTVVLNRAIEDDGGYRKKYKSYSEEIESVLHLPVNSPNYNPLSIFQGKANYLFDAASSLHELAAIKAPERMLDDARRSYAPTILAYQEGWNVFSGWVASTRQRIKQFNLELRQSE